MTVKGTITKAIVLWPITIRANRVMNQSQGWKLHFWSICQLGKWHSDCTFLDSHLKTALTNWICDKIIPLLIICLHKYDVDVIVLFVTWVSKQMLVLSILLPQLTLTSSWRTIRKLIKDDPRYSKFSSHDSVRNSSLTSSSLALMKIFHLFHR